MKGTKELTIDEFYELAKEELLAFKKFWDIRRKNEPNFYPEKLMIGDWYEQLGFFDQPNKITKVEKTEE